jgi:hypothetical protein
VANTANDLERVQKLSEPQIEDDWGNDEKPHPHGCMPSLWFVGLVIEMMTPVMRLARMYGRPVSPKIQAALVSQPILIEQCQNCLNLDAPKWMTWMIKQCTLEESPELWRCGGKAG